MAIPSSVKIKKDGVEYLSNCDRTKYTLKELTRAALRDTGKFICNRSRKLIKRKTGRLAKNIQYWVRSKKETPDLQVGIKAKGFYGIFQEIGASNRGIPRIAAISNSTKDNISEIREIQGQYLSAIEDENKALGIINEEEYQGE